MCIRYLLPACLLAGVAATPALAANTFQNTCSEIRFAYSGNNATLQAVCLKADGTPNVTPLSWQGISNQNGKLTQGTGPSTFQQSCGNIQILINNGPNATLSALCRTMLKPWKKVPSCSRFRGREAHRAANFSADGEVGGAIWKTRRSPHEWRNLSQRPRIWRSWSLTRKARWSAER